MTNSEDGIIYAQTHNNRLQLAGISAAPYQKPALENISINYNGVGNNGTIASITNSVNTGLGENFTYDGLDRVKTGATAQANVSGCWGNIFGLTTPPGQPADDIWSNLTQISVSQCTGGSLSAAVDTSTNRISVTGSSINPAGNMSNDGIYAYTFDAENHITEASGMSGGPWYYIYDGNGLRVAKCSNPTHSNCTTRPTGGTLYWRDIFGNAIEETDLSGNLVEDYIYFNGRKIAQEDSSGNTQYLYPDQVGSTVMMATVSSDGQSATTCYSATFTPYGEEHPASGNSCSTNYKFTGYERDAETGLDYAFARYYSYRLGRFMSADPLGGSITNPQSLNRYAYVGNNPVSYTDPSGLFYYPCANYSGDCWSAQNDFGGGGGGGGAWGGSSPFCWGDYCGAWEAPGGVSLAQLFDPTLSGSEWSPGGGIVCSGDTCTEFPSLVDTTFMFSPGSPAEPGGGGGTPQTPASKPCPPSGSAPSPTWYQAEAQTARFLNSGINASGSFINALNLFSFHRGGLLDAQASGASPAYGNYAFGVYMSAYGYSLSSTLSAADAYGAVFSTYHPTSANPMDTTYMHIPAANVMNITNGYNDQQHGTLCNPH